MNEHFPKCWTICFIIWVHQQTKQQTSIIWHQNLQIYGLFFPEPRLRGSYYLVLTHMWSTDCSCWSFFSFSLHTPRKEWQCQIWTHVTHKFPQNTKCFIVNFSKKADTSQRPQKFHTSCIRGTQWLPQEFQCWSAPTSFMWCCTMG